MGAAASSDLRGFSEVGGGDRGGVEVRWDRRRRRYKRPPRMAARMRTTGMVTPMAILAPVERLVMVGEGWEEGAEVLAAPWAVLLEPDELGAALEVVETAAMTSPGIVGRVALGSTDHRLSEVGQLSALLEGVYTELGVLEGVALAHWLLKLV